MEGRARGTRPLVLTDPTLLVRRANERLVMMRERKEVAAVPIADLSHVAVHGPVTLTGAAVAGLLDAGVDVTLYSSAGFYRGTVTSAQSKKVYLMLAQVDAWRRDERRTEFARGLLAGKIAGQRAVLHRQARDRGSERCREASERLKVLERMVGEEETVDGARGVEGAAGAAYFDVFGEVLSEGWSWNGRVRRPATDPVNAVLSYGYALATGEMVRLLIWGGFDTRVGLVHSHGIETRSRPKVRSTATARDEGLPGSHGIETGRRASWRTSCSGLRRRPSPAMPTLAISP